MLRAHLSPVQIGGELETGPNGPPWYTIKAVPAMPDISYVNSHHRMMCRMIHRSSVVQKQAMILAELACQMIGYQIGALWRVKAAHLYLKVIYVSCSFFLYSFTSHIIYILLLTNIDDIILYFVLPHSSDVKQHFSFALLGTTEPTSLGKTK